METVVVGVDGSEQSQAGLAWAAEYAKRRGAKLRVVTVYGPSEERNPHSLPRGGFGGVSQMAQQARMAEEWRDAQDRIDYDRAERRMKRMLKQLDDDILPDTIEEIAVEGTRPSRVLIDLAQGADLLVVGSRGRGGFKGLVLGSVSQQLANHAPCSVLIVR